MFDVRSIEKLNDIACELVEAGGKQSDAIRVFCPDDELFSPLEVEDAVEAE